MKNFTSRAVTCSLVILLGLLSALPNVLPDTTLEKLPDWYAANQLALGLDLRGGSHLLLAVDTSEILPEESLDEVMERSLEVVRRRLDETGMVEPTITRQGQDSILIQLPGVNDPGHIRDLLGTTAKMTFHWAANDSSLSVQRVPGQNEGEYYQLEKRVALKGEHIRDARLAFNPDSNEPVVNFKLDREGARAFGEMTLANVGRPLAIVLDDTVLTAPVIRTPIMGGSGEISGGFSSREAHDLALMLRAGALPVPLTVIEERTVGPDLGSDAIAMGISTGLMGAGLVLAFMLALYGRWGLIACAGLSINIGLVFGTLSLLGATLTLPGIAGIILTIGMAVDANILINERIREEARKGLSARAALAAGFNRAYGTILDSSITTLIAISLLFLFGAGPIRGFAVTIAIGLLMSLFTAITVTRLLMEWRTRHLGRAPLEMSGPRFLQRLAACRPLNFMGTRFWGLALSALLSLGALGLLAQPGLNYGIDFSGGSLVEVRADVDVEQLRAGFRTQGLEQLAIQEFGGAGQFLVRLPEQTAEQVASGAPVQELKDAVLTLAPEAEFPRVEMVGPRVSGDFADASILAVLLAGTGMLLYLWFRFESHFASAIIATLALDLAKTLGFFVLLGIEFNLTAIAALLALIGYSVNDKVVVFDRIRENLRLTPDRPLKTVLNESITSTLSRTLFTSVTTFLAVLPMAVAGGSAVASFALPMLFGIVVGTSSSIYIAAPILMLLGERRDKKGLPQLRAELVDDRP
ncbi:protein translocase subunit SecD [Marinimicrobium sp. ABcell2]|uniref:protein translocase subunit SecD n=1 Tax=Marinimicrobium sp. ABcell2 TaxID=3069751 RepID=UPI0027B214D4|nr:protein translocase subunit SecD [Marinimicrobium sp. ABcell2]MDQ2077984.1 protein translocase subunit SecD [Marinimicrobium sp. ABcell2]